MAAITSAIIAGASALAGAAGAVGSAALGAATAVGTTAAGIGGFGLGLAEGFVGALGAGGMGSLFSGLLPMFMGGKTSGGQQPQQVAQAAPAPLAPVGQTAEELKRKSELDTRRATLSKARSRTNTLLTTSQGTQAGNLQRKTLFGE